MSASSGQSGGADNSFRRPSGLPPKALKGRRPIPESDLTDCEEDEEVEDLGPNTTITDENGGDDDDEADNGPADEDRGDSGSGSFRSASTPSPRDTDPDFNPDDTTAEGSSELE